MSRLLWVLLLGLGVDSLAWGEEGKWSYWISGGQSALILGSEDSRRALNVAVQYGRREPRLKIAGLEPHLVYEGYASRSTSRGRFEFGPDTTYMFGALGLSRWETFATGTRAYLELGWGLQYATRVTLDLPSLWNSTPVVGLGLIFPCGRSRLLAGLRLMHVSNAGTRGNNPGQNVVSLSLGWEP
jgi:hypothetical protein